MNYELNPFLYEGIRNDELLVECRFHPGAKGGVTRKVDPCRSPDEFARSVEKMNDGLDDDQLFDYAVLTTRYWRERIETYQELVGEASYASGDDGSFSDFDDLIRRNAKYVCWYHDDLSEDINNTVGPEELMHVLNIAANYGKGV